MYVRISGITFYEFMEWSEVRKKLNQNKLPGSIKWPLKCEFRCLENFHKSRKPLRISF